VATQPKHYFPPGFPKPTCQEINKVLDCVKYAISYTDEDNHYLCSCLNDIPDYMESLRTANAALREAALGYRDNRDEWMSYAFELHDEIENLKKTINELQLMSKE
jgi:hypothetical protein